MMEFIEVTKYIYYNKLIITYLNVNGTTSKSFGKRTNVI